MGEGWVCVICSGSGDSGGDGDGVSAGFYNGDSNAVTAMR